MKPLLLLLLLSGFFSPLRAQHQERHLLLYNTLFGGITAGTGSAINKPKDENWRKAFLRGFWQGCIGGSLLFAGKKMTYPIYKQEAPVFGWPAKIIHSGGVAIIENAGLRQPFLQNWFLDYGPLRADYNVKTRNLRARFLPWSIYSILSAANNSELDLHTSLSIGELSFRYKGTNIPGYNGGFYLGQNYGRAFSYVPGQDQYFIMAHELVHSLQFREYQVINIWFKPTLRYWKEGKLKTSLRKWVFFDFPWHYIAYGMEGYHRYPRYFRNFFELEAQRFALGRHVDVQ